VTQKSQNYLYIKNTQENNNNNLSQVLDERKAIVIIGRQHPGETVGSYVVKGCIDFLMGDSEEAKKLREVYVFKIVPMMNPDGVLVGNS
jgi:murein tripeptide amidase MpaA